tara:strand:+ start:3572 stop:3727 length:156 start_codon:yes stop_codon:yes gene_type:complete
MKKNKNFNEMTIDEKWEYFKSIPKGWEAFSKEHVFLIQFLNSEEFKKEIKF